MQRSWQKPLAAMSWSWLPTSTSPPSARATMAGERSWANLRRCASPTSQRLLPGCAAFHPAPVTTHHTQPEPHQRPKQRRHDRVPPQRPGEGPEQELESDPVGVLDDENQEDPDADQRRDRPATQFAPVRLLPVRLLPTRLNRHHVLLMSRSTGGFSATVCHLGGAAALAVAGSSATRTP